MRRILLAAIVISACLWDASASQVHTILIQGFQFQPGNLTVPAGDTVEWKNADIVPPTVTSGDKAFHSGLIQPGHSWKVVVRKTGTFSYSCTPHPNMKAVLVVGQTPLKRQ
jgi:plastocyanin